MRGHARGKTWLICTTCRNGSASGGGGGGGGGATQGTFPTPGYFILSSNGTL